MASSTDSIPGNAALDQRLRIELTDNRAAVLVAPRQFQLQIEPPPLEADNQVVVQVEGCGLCASSLPVWEGRPWFDYPLAPGAPGHEAWGRIVAAGQRVKELHVGQRVTCLADNAYVKYLAVAPENVVPLPPALDGQPFPGEAVACAMNIFRRADIHSGQSVAVIGAGFLGLLLVQLAVDTGARVFVLSRRESARQLAMASGAVAAFDAEDWFGSARAILARTGNRGCERVFEVTGLQFALDAATAMIGEYGKLLVGGYHQDGLRQVNMQQWNWRAIDVINAHEREPRRYLDGMRLGVAATLSGRIRPRELLTHTFRFEQLDRAFQTLLERPEGFIKAWVTP
jgi:2-desacetyl-2-hydroxyethyl bacteriochlorophyllide A dehydrogenase